MTSQRPLASALDKVFPHLLILLYGLGAAVIYDHHWPFRGHGDSPILDLVEHHYPTFYKALTLWHYLPPMVAVLLAGMLLLSVYRVWIATDGPQAERGALPSWLDSYSLAYTISSLLNPLFGKGKEPFWQQACLHRRLEAKTLNQPVPVVESANFFQTPNQFQYRLPTNTDHCLSFCILTGMLTHAGGTEAGTMVGFAGSI